MEQVEADLGPVTVENAEARRQRIAQILTHDCKFRWLSKYEIIDILRNFQNYQLAFCSTPPCRPDSGSSFLFNKDIVRHWRDDGHSWKKKTTGRSGVVESHMAIKVNRRRVLNCCYTHCDEISGFQRRAFWLLENPSIVLVQYLNVGHHKIRFREQFNNKTWRELIPLDNNAEFEKIDFGCNNVQSNEDESLSEDSQLDDYRISKLQSQIAVLEDKISQKRLENEIDKLKLQRENAIESLREIKNILEFPAEMKLLFWLFSRPSTFYDIPNGLWESLMINELQVSPNQEILLKNNTRIQISDLLRNIETLDIQLKEFTEAFELWIQDQELFQKRLSSIMTADQIEKFQSFVRN